MIIIGLREMTKMNGIFIWSLILISFQKLFKQLFIFKFEEFKKNNSFELKFKALSVNS